MILIFSSVTGGKHGRGYRSHSDRAKIKLTLQLFSNRWQFLVAVPVTKKVSFPTIASNAATVALTWMSVTSWSTKSFWLVQSGFFHCQAWVCYIPCMFYGYKCPHFSSRSQCFKCRKDIFLLPMESIKHEMIFSNWDMMNFISVFLRRKEQLGLKDGQQASLVAPTTH